jgi:hypothetical protein
MTKKERAALGKRVCKDLVGFCVKGPLLFVCPVDHTLRGIYFDSSSFDKKRFFVQIFLQPLFVPAPTLAFNLGWRLGGDAHFWTSDAPDADQALIVAIKDKVIPFFGAVQATTDLIAAARQLGKTADPYVKQVVAYAYAREGDATRAQAQLEELANPVGLDTAWKRDIAERASLLRRLLRSSPSAGTQQLDHWEHEMVQKLELDAFRYGADNSVVTCNR